MNFLSAHRSSNATTPATQSVSAKRIPGAQSGSGHRRLGSHTGAPSFDRATRDRSTAGVVVQAFQKVPFLQQLAPKQLEPPFIVAQLIVRVTFVAFGGEAVWPIRSRYDIETNTRLPSSAGDLARRRLHQIGPGCLRQSQNLCDAIGRLRRPPIIVAFEAQPATCR